MSNEAKTPLQVLVDVINKRLRKIFPTQDVGLMGQIDFHLRKADGSVSDWSLKNLIMDAGENAVAALLGLTGTAFKYVAIGTNNTTPVDSQTTLIAEISTNGGARQLSTSYSATANVYTVSVTFTFTGVLAIMEVGLFNAASAGAMLARQIFAVINVDNNDQLTVTWSITCGVAR